MGGNRVALGIGEVQPDCVGEAEVEEGPHGRGGGHPEEPREEIGRFLLVADLDDGVVEFDRHVWILPCGGRVGWVGRVVHRGGPPTGWLLRIVENGSTVALTAIRRCRSAAGQHRPTSPSGPRKLNTLRLDDQGETVSCTPVQGAADRADEGRNRGDPQGEQRVRLLEVSGGALIGAAVGETAAEVPDLKDGQRRAAVLTDLVDESIDQFVVETVEQR